MWRTSICLRCGYPVKNHNRRKQPRMIVFDTKNDMYVGWVHRDCATDPHSLYEWV